jgi:hypothetical protein
MKEKFSTIRIRETTKHQLNSLKSDGETYDELLNRLLSDSYKLHRAREICVELKTV